LLNVVILSAPFARWSQDPYSLHLYSDTQVHVDWFACYAADCITTIPLRVHQVRATNFHISFLVDSCHCVWNYMRQSYGLTYYSLHYTRSRLLVTSQPISQNMLMTANYCTIRLFNIANVSEFRHPHAHVHHDVSTWLWKMSLMCVCVCLWQP